MKLLRLALSLLVLTLIAMISLSCSQVFSDRERDYQYSSEIPALETPPDLIESYSEDPSVDVPDASGTASYSEYLKEQNSAGAAETRPLAGETAKSPNQAKLVQNDESAFLEVPETYQTTWSLVGKALSHAGFEVVDRNQAIGTYSLVYADGETQQKEDKGLLSEWFFFWRGDEEAGNEKQYRVKLKAAGNVTKVLMLDDTGNPQKEGTALQLLRTILDNIKAS